MRRKIFFCGVLAIVIILMMSLISVAGIQVERLSTQSGDSPLFTIRTKKAIKEKCLSPEGNYIKKDKAIIIPILFLELYLYKESLKPPSSQTYPSCRSHCFCCNTKSPILWNNDEDIVIPLLLDSDPHKKSTPFPTCNTYPSCRSHCWGCVGVEVEKIAPSPRI